MLEWLRAQPGNAKRHASILADTKRGNTLFLAFEFLRRAARHSSTP
jgi:hypothetical protein